ncbi:MAG: LLM class flavin-dependent oxidoreductase [Chloroflexi bacterium]|nr:LLM class flavin-dependent oxidoreductase [Chloroflexota bacterium]
MKFGLVLRGQYPMGDDMGTRFDEIVEQGRTADALGFDSLTATSHYSTPPFQSFQQVPMLARLSAEAPNVRLNAGIVLLSLYTPLEIAEQFATLDIMSGGRIIFGAALGYRDVEFKAFGVPMNQRARRFEQNLIAIKRLWTEESVDMKGDHFELVGASCLPKPLQDPHPPIWIGANADAAIKRAARLGDCWYINPHNRISTIKRQMEIYRQALDVVGKPFPEELPMRRELFVARTREEAMRVCGPYIQQKYDAYQSWGQQRQMPEGDNDLGGGFEELLGDRFLIGSPDDVAEQILGLRESIGINHLIMSIEWGGMPQGLILETLHLIAEEVIPKVRAEQ